MTETEIIAAIEERAGAEIDRAATIAKQHDYEAAVLGPRVAACGHMLAINTPDSLIRGVCEEALGGPLYYKSAYYGTTAYGTYQELKARPEERPLARVSYPYLLAEICLLGVLGAATFWLIIVAMDHLLTESGRPAKLGWGSLAAAAVLCSFAIWLAFEFAL